MQIKDVHHVAIITSCYERSKYFYTKQLGLSIISEVYRKDKASYKLDLRVNNTTQIELFSFPNPPKRVDSPEACGLRHLAFSVANLDQEVEELQSKGIDVEIVRVDPLTNKRYTFFKDPDQLPIELYESYIL